MVASREVEFITQFEGGLNLTDQTQKLEDNQTPDCLNVDFSSVGGFALRSGFRSQAFNFGLDDARIIGDYDFATEGVLLQLAGGEMWDWDGTSLTDTTEVITDDDDERVRSAKHGSAVYLANGRNTGSLIMQKWDGTTLSTLTNLTDQNTYTTPTGTDMPLARYIAEHNNFMWVADTVESATRHPNRVRFSHLGFPESWADADYFEVGAPNTHDPITGLLPFGSRLLIFKSYSVWVVSGFDRDTFTLERVTNASGTCTCGAMAANSGVAYWFSTDGQLMAYNGADPDYDGAGVVSLSEPLDYWSRIGKIKHGGAHRLMWHDGRLWLSLEAGSGEDVSRWLFIWEPSVRAFTRYDFQASDLFAWSRFQADQQPLFLKVGNFNLYSHDGSWETDYGVEVDDLLDDGAGGYLTDGSGNPLLVDGADEAKPIVGYYRTSWIDAGETATRKRWKRPRITAAGTQPATIKVEVFHDFNDRAPNRSSDFLIEADAVTSKWGTMLWGDVWESGADEYYEFERLQSSGTAFAVSYKFSSQNNLGRWWVDGIAIPFRRKGVR